MTGHEHPGSRGGGRRGPSEHRHLAGRHISRAWLRSPGAPWHGCKQSVAAVQKPLSALFHFPGCSQSWPELQSMLNTGHGAPSNQHPAHYARSPWGMFFIILLIVWIGRHSCGSRICILYSKSPPPFLSFPPCFSQLTVGNQLFVCIQSRVHIQILMQIDSVILFFSTL